MTDEPDKKKKPEARRTRTREMIVAGVVAALLLGAVFAVTEWPTLYRYEVKYRCVFDPVTEPFRNEFSGQEKTHAEQDSIEEFLWRRRRAAKTWMRLVRSRITDEQYKVHRISGEIYKLEKGRWVFKGILFEKPEEFMDSYNGKTPEGCRRLSESIEQHSDFDQGPWEEFKPERAKQ